MTGSISRRAWFKRTGTALAGAALTPHLAAAAPRRGLAGADDPTNGYARLNFNENPFGPSPLAQQAAVDAVAEGCRYPYAEGPELAKMLGERVGLPADHVLLGPGSSEILCMAAAAYGKDGGEFVAGFPTYRRMMAYAEQFGVYTHWVPLDDEMRFDLNALDRRVTGATRLVFVCNPNNPTGTIVPGERLADFCKSVSDDAVVFVDEAYYELVDPAQRASMVDLVKEGCNVIVSRTFSKLYGMAGLRVGYAYARPDVVARLQPYNMNGMNLVGIRAAKASLLDEEFAAFSYEKNAEARAYAQSVFKELGLRSTDTQTNFAFFHTGRPVEEIQEGMRERGVLIGRAFPPHLDWCRVSMGKMDDMHRFGDALREIMS